MGLLASGTASLLPKEAFDKGWRKVVVLIATLITIPAATYLPFKAGQWEVALGIAATMVSLSGAYLGINIKQHAKEIEKFLPIITKAIENLGGEKEKT